MDSPSLQRNIYRGGMVASVDCHMARGGIYEGRVVAFVGWRDLSKNDGDG